MLFNYRARDEKGVVKKGSVEASSEVQASEVLHRNGLVVLKLEPEEIGFNLENYIPFLNRVSGKELVIFSRQLSTLINAKVPIVQALQILQEQVSSRKLKGVLEEMINDIEGGKSLSESIVKFPQIFSNLYLNMVRSGEVSGKLDESLLYLADQEEKNYELSSKIRGALTYPIFIVSAIFVVGALMFVFVLPQMIGVLKEAGAALPPTTKVLIFLTEAVQHYGILLVILLVALAVGIRFYLRSEGGRLVWDAVKVKLPVFGKLLKNIYMDRLARNLGTLVGGGIPIVQALHTVADIVGNQIYRQIILDAADEVETGKSIASVFAERREIPKIVTQMIKIGEETGALHDILGKLASFYDKEVEKMLATLTTLLEPLIMIVLGLAVAVMVAGILLPIYNLANVQ